MARADECVSDGDVGDGDSADRCAFLRLIMLVRSVDVGADKTPKVVSLKCHRAPVLTLIKAACILR